MLRHIPRSSLLYSEHRRVRLIPRLGLAAMRPSAAQASRKRDGVPAAEASLISMLEPVLNPVWVLIGFGERPGRWALAGGAIVIAAVLVRTLLPQPQRASTTSV